MLRLWIYGTIFGLRLIAYLIPAWVGLTVIGLIFMWPHMPDFARSVATWGIIHMVVAFVCAIPFWLFLDVPIAAGTIGCLVIVLCGEAAPIISKVWHTITHTVSAAVGAITPVHWAAAAVGITGFIVIESWKAWRRRVPCSLADDDDDNFDDDPTDPRIVLRLAPPRPPTRAERKRAERAAAEAANAKAWEAWGKGNGPRPPL